MSIPIVLWEEDSILAVTDVKTSFGGLVPMMFPFDPDKGTHNSYGTGPVYKPDTYIGCSTMVKGFSAPVRWHLDTDTYSDTFIVSLVSFYNERLHNKQQRENNASS